MPYGPYFNCIFVDFFLFMGGGGSFCFATVFRCRLHDRPYVLEGSVRCCASAPRRWVSRRIRRCEDQPHDAMACKQLKSRIFQKPKPLVLSQQSCRASGRRTALQIGQEVYCGVSFLLKLETGRIRFRGVRFQTPSSVSFSGLTEFRGANSLSSFQHLCARANSPSFAQNSPSLPQNSVRLSEFSSPKQYSRNSIPPVPFFKL